MDLNELQSVRDRERQTDKLQQLRESFYGDVGEFIEQLRAERDRAVERADSPFDSSDVRQLSDEINTAEQTVKAIYEKRVGKIVKAASFAAADMPAEVDGMTAEEQDLFDQLVADIKQNRSGVMALLDGEDRSSTGPNPTSQPSDTGTQGQASPEGKNTDTVPQEPPTDRRSSQNNRPHTSDGSDGDREADTDDLSAADVMGGGNTDATSRDADTGREDTDTTEARQYAPPDATEPSARPPLETDSDNGVTQSGSPSKAEPQVRNDGGATRTETRSETGVSREQGPAADGNASTSQTTGSHQVTETTDTERAQSRSDGPSQSARTESVEQERDAASTARGQHRPSRQQNGTQSVESSIQETQNGRGQSGTNPTGEQESKSRANIDRQRVQILEDVDTFMGFDERDYDLQSNDVVSLPATNADILVERGVARRL